MQVNSSMANVTKKEQAYRLLLTLSATLATMAMPCCLAAQLSDTTEAASANWLGTSHGTTRGLGPVVMVSV
jgi:sulfur transfer protein SufE